MPCFFVGLDFPRFCANDCERFANRGGLSLTWYSIWLFTHGPLLSVSPSAFLSTAASKAAVDSAETAVIEAQEETTKAIGAEEDDDDGTSTRPPPKSIMSNDEEYKLESSAKKARKAGSSVPQVCKTYS